MAGRPEILYPLFASMTSLQGIGPKVAQNLAAIGLEKPRDLLLHLPSGLMSRRTVDTVQDVCAGQMVVIKISVLAHEPPRRAGLPYRIKVRDSKGIFRLVFFQARARFLQELLPVDEQRIISGKVEHFDGKVQIVHPEVMPQNTLPESISLSEPVYPMGAGITAKAIRKAAVQALDRLPDFAEWIEPSLLAQKKWPSFNAAIKTAHHPTSKMQLSPLDPARERLAYDEFFSHQLTMAILRHWSKRRSGVANFYTGKLQAKAWTAAGFPPTAAQERCISQILLDLKAPERMSRLLQGDVGSGKTFVAFIAMLAAVEAGGQAALMAPTEVLAKQHQQSLAPLAKQLGVRIQVLIGRTPPAERKALLERVAQGEIDILIGTHALFQNQVSFKDLRLAVIDEQHRFGVEQRLALGNKGHKTDILVMSATPIPRSLEMAQYGDMDVSILDEKPAGRKPVVTAVLSMERLGEVTQKVKKAADAGRQIYWVCPMVTESELSDLSAAEDRFKALRAELGEGRVGLVHGQMHSAAKDQVMAQFEAGEISVLVATTVIEVGVNIPNASIMIIERAEHFGLAQLHQLRGRVGRGTQASSCVLLYQPPLSNAARRRLHIMRDTEDGFLISEEDLKIRGSGDVIGTAQSGIPKFTVASLEGQTHLMQLAQKDARLLLTTDPNLHSARGKAARMLLWFMEQEKTIPLISIG